jgi:hypothetical protein
MTNRSIFVPAATAILVLLVSGCAGRKQHTVADGAVDMARNTTYDLNDTSASREVPPSSSTWTCPMHPGVRQSRPGSCPICGMDLVPSEGSSAVADSRSHADHSSSSHSGGSRSSGSSCH